jgi:hypothetical protein
MMGMENDASISIGGRWQMLGFGSEPRTAFISGQTGINTKSNSALNPSSGKLFLISIYMSELSRLSKVEFFNHIRRICS